ncbi:MAG: methionyl-tRNA formyltransferase [Gammaproteobacteria bacterium]|nr:methionyl-tRNA formyltransferase [Gammaproteobacteria bacterium]
MKNPRVIFAGTPEFALASLSALVDSGITPCAVLTQPDRPAGRGKRLTESPVKRYATAHDIAVLQPVTLRNEEAAAELARLEPDVLIVAAYGLILPQSVLDIPRAGCLNVHASLLPRWRGAAPIQAAILAGDEITGISLMAMTAGLDCGPVYVTSELRIGEEETAGELHDRLAQLGGELLVAHLGDILKGRLAASDQDDEQASYAGKINKQDAELDWAQDAASLARRVRAYNPVPGAYFFVDQKATQQKTGQDPLRIKCWRAAVVSAADALPGTVLQCNRDGLVIACGDDALAIKELQLPGKKRGPAREVAQQLDLEGQTLC